MILRRFMLHVKEQNWLAVGLDVIVVIVGIFLGLQVQAWYEDRTLLDQEKEYLNQLHEEVNLLDNQVSRFLSNRNDRLENLFILNNYFADNLEVEEFTMAQCNAMLFSHLLNNPAMEIPTVTDLLSSGQLTIFSDKELTNLISLYTSMLEQLFQNHTRMSVRAEYLPGKFQDLLEFAPVTEFPGYSVDKLYNHCDFEAMKENKQFKTALIANHQRQNANVNLMKAQYSILHDIHLKLDDLLHILHDDETD